MLIVSQDEDKIYNFDNIKRIYVSYTSIYAETICNDYRDEEWLGSYKRKEQAKEVLQEIVEAYKSENVLYVENTPVDDHQIKSEIKNIFHKQEVYYMPKKIGGTNENNNTNASKK